MSNMPAIPLPPNELRGVREFVLVFSKELKMAIAEVYCSACNEKDYIFYVTPEEKSSIGKLAACDNCASQQLRIKFW